MNGPLARFSILKETWEGDPLLKEYAVRASVAFVLALLSTGAHAKGYPTWQQDGLTLPLGVRKVCIGDQYYLLVVEGGVPGGSWPRSITPALLNGQPESCKEPAEETGKLPGSNWNTK